MRSMWCVGWLVLITVLSGCVTPKVGLLGDGKASLKEFVLEGVDQDKILVIPVRGFISDAPQKDFFRDKPSLVEQIVSRLQKAENDSDVKAVLLTVNSPGGTSTASDILYHEIMTFKEKTKRKIVVSLMDIGASGGYYVSLPADCIVAHPTSVTGSVGVIFMRPKVQRLMEKIGLSMEVSRSGEKKDMGSPFRETTEQEAEILQDVVDQLADRFIRLVKKHRHLDDAALAKISSGRIYLPDEAKTMGLIDDIGYVSDAVEKAKTLAGLSENPRIVVYRRSEHANDNIYNMEMMASGPQPWVLFPDVLPKLDAGFYYIWLSDGMSMNR